MTPQLPERPSLPQALNTVHPARRTSVPLRIVRAASQGLLETPGPTPMRTAWDERDVDGQTRPLHLSGADWRPEPFKAPPEDGGCVRCEHVEGAHRRGKSTSTRCVATDCTCAGYRQLWTWRDTAGAVITVLLWLAAFAVVLGVAAVVIGGTQ